VRRAFLLLTVAVAIGPACSPRAPRAIEVPDAERAPAPSTPIRRFLIESGESSVTATATAAFARYPVSFPAVEGQIDWVDAQPARSQFRIELDMTAATGSIAAVTRIVRSADFLDVERYPSARFVSRAVLIEGPGEGRVRGELDLHGVSRVIEVPGRFELAGPRLRLTSEFSLDRRDFGIESDGALDALVKDTIVVRLTLVATESARKAVRAD
jgi:polyisoprenoid-binding protein YceI